MAVKAFTFDMPLTDHFVRLGYELYRDDPGWIPPLRKDLAAQLSPAFSFYGKAGNDHRRFLAIAGGKPVARVLASVNAQLDDSDGTAVGALGFFEADDDRAAVEDVLGEACRWLREAHAIRRVWGPLQFDIWHGYRFMTRGFDRQPFYGEPHNRPCYPEHFERFGFAVRKRWNSFELNGREPLERLLAGREDRRRRLVERGYRLEAFDLRHWDETVARLHSVLTRSFSGFLGYTPILPAEFREVMGIARHAVHPECSVFVYDEQGALCGFAGVFLDVSDAVRAMAGSTTLASRLRFLYHRRRSRRALLHVGGITPEEAAKRSGVAADAFYHVLGELRAEGFDTVLGTLVAKGNPVRRLFEEYAAGERREYALYELNL